MFKALFSAVTSGVTLFAYSRKALLKLQSDAVSGSATRSAAQPS
jgi:hypothetical protein